MADNRNTGPNHNNNSAGTKKPKCFVMMPFSDHLEYEQNHFSKVFNQIIKPAIMQAGYEPVRVDQNKISDQIIAKIIENIVECDMAICDLSTNNPNVLYELGLRHAFDKPVVLIRDNKTQNIFDIQGISIIQYRSERLYDEVIEDVNQISSVITANKKGNSGYSMMQLVKLSSKAEFNANDVDANPSNINTALLHQIINKILQRLLDFTQAGIKGQKELNARFIKDHSALFEKVDVSKQKAIKYAFVNSRILLIYGAAGTGKTTLINYISSLMPKSKKLFLTKTHAAIQHLQRRIDNPGSDSDFICIDSFTRRVNLPDYDIIFVDECSTIDNRTMLNFIRVCSH